MKYSEQDVVVFEVTNIGNRHALYDASILKEQKTRLIA